MNARSVRVTSTVFKVCDDLDELEPERREARNWQWPMSLMRIKIFEPRVPIVFVGIDIYAPTYSATEDG